MKITKNLKAEINGKMRREEVWQQIESEREALERRLREEEAHVYDEYDDYDRRYREWRDEGGTWK